jgi:toxin ParE1/3/4
MAKKIRLSQDAKDDLQSIWDYIGQFNETAADRMVDGLVEAYLSLLDNPERGREREELLPGLRDLLVKKYLVFYKIDGDVIVVARILHGMRDFEAVFSSGGDEDS